MQKLRKAHPELHSPEKLGGEGSFGLAYYLDGAAGAGEGGVTGVTPQVNFLRNITFDTLYTNEFIIRVCSRALAIPSECTTL